MTTSMIKLLDTGVMARDGNCPVREVFFHGDDYEITYLALDLGGWFEIDEVLIEAALLEGNGNAGWSVPLDRTTLDAAPRWGSGPGGPTDLTHWPPIIVGPFGGTYSPILMYEQAVAARRRQDRAAPEEEGMSLVFRMERATEWIGLPVDGPEGQVGTVSDILFDPGTGQLTAVEIRSGSLLNRDVTTVPMTSVLQGERGQSRITKILRLTDDRG